MIATTSASTRTEGQILLKKVLLGCGIISSLLYVAMNIFVPMQYPGYSSTSQTISELSAIGAPTRTLWVILGTIYTLLVTAFGWGVLKSSQHKRSLRIAGLLLIIYGLIGVVWPPMHQREVLAAGGGTLSDTLHIAITFVVIPLMLLVIAFGAASFGKGFRIYSIITILVLLGSGVFVGIDSPNLQANLPTPWIGVWERICIGVYMLWIVVFATKLLPGNGKVEHKN